MCPVIHIQALIIMMSRDYILTQTVFTQ